MNLKEYIDNLNKLVKRHPEALEYEVIYVEDAEGNGYANVYYEPTLGCWGVDGYDFIPEDNFFEYVDEIEDLQPNVVCIN